MRAENETAQWRGSLSKLGSTARLTAATANGGKISKKQT
jgi:hypothetical protein